MGAGAGDRRYSPLIALTNANGKQVTGELRPDRRTYEITEPLGYEASYTWSGTAVGADRKPVPIDGSFTTLSPVVSATPMPPQAPGGR
ncbi:Ig-like domain-containing protein [Nocardia sp. NPDC050710]|uniref:Ig-like domain-containing protein n=1 Tax=Nocardia sp. NPDC050710 TaxID=3157220 RepID=UPI0033DD1478